MRGRVLMAVSATVADLFQYAPARGNLRLAEVTEVGDELGVVLFVPPMLPLALVRNAMEGRAVLYLDECPVRRRAGGRAGEIGQNRFNILRGLAMIVRIHGHSSLSSLPPEGIIGHHRGASQGQVTSCAGGIEGTFRRHDASFRCHVASCPRASPSGTAPPGRTAH